MMSKRETDEGEQEFNHPAFFGWLLGLTALSSLSASGPWNLRMGVWVSVLGVLMLAFRGVTKLERGSLVLAGCFVFLGLAPFLPVEWVGKPEWRVQLESLGVETGSRIVIQVQKAIERHLSMLLLFFAGLWLLKHRASPTVLRNVALLFVVWVALYSVFSVLFLEQESVGKAKTLTSQNHFGFFPNRNHAANYLAMGFVCGLGVIFQAIRNKHFWRLAISLLATTIILWAAYSWSISRAGIVFSLIGSVLWLVLLGRRYFGVQELKAIALVALLALGVYGISEFRVKERLSETIEKASEINESQGELTEGDSVNFADLDLRVPIAKDALAMISHSPLTGVGAGQFRHTFPQYRDQTIGVNRSMAAHPESSWMWLAAEIGIPATFCLLVFVLTLFYRGIQNIRRRGGRDRAIRFGCLVAAAIVPLHSCFDVPAHRPVLALTSVMLFVLSQNPSEGGSKQMSRWPSLVLGCLLLGGALRIFGGSWLGLGELAVVKSENDLKESVELYKKISDRKESLSMMESLKPRQQLDASLTKQKELSPLDGRLYRMSGLVNLPLDYRADEVKRNFEIDRALTPYSVGIPMIHGTSTMPYDLEEAKKAWLVALERSCAVDQIDAKQQMESRTLRQIQSRVRKQEELKEWLEGVIEQQAPRPQ